MNDINIIIIDNLENRRNGLKRQIAKYGGQWIQSVVCRKEVFINQKDDGFTGDHNLLQQDEGGGWKKQWEADLIDISRFDLIFLHIGNPFIDSFYKIKCEDLANKVIGYSGGETPYWFKNPNYLKDVGTARDAADLLHFKDFFEDWLSNEQQNRERFDVPWNFLKLRGEDVVYLPAVSILCQGYLGVFAESCEYEVDAVVREALEKIGVEIMKKTLSEAKITSQLVKKDDSDVNVGDPAWFRDSFEKNGMKKDDLVKAIRSEWGTGHEEDLEIVIKLIDAMYSKDSSNYTPKTVAGAYLAIAKKTGE